MKIVHLNTYDIEGGAARAAYRLHRGLQHIGLESHLLVQKQFSDDASVMGPEGRLAKIMAQLRSPLSKLPTLAYHPQPGKLFSPPAFSDSIAARVAQWKPDIVNLNWVCHGFLAVETLKRLPCPIVWTLMDMWAFTGGCHYSEECDRYQGSCGACPQLNSHQVNDVSRWIWQRKAKHWKSLNLTVVSPSRWLADCARRSSLFRHQRVEVIPYGLDTMRYRPQDRRLVRQLLHLPQEKQLVLFGAIQATHDRRKGWALLEEALQRLSQKVDPDRIELVVFGASQPKDLPNLGFNVSFLGHLHDDIALSLVYAAADLIVVPSLQEAFGQTASEALACGTPVVAFDATGLSDIVTHQQTGYLAKPYAIDDLVQGILWILSSSTHHQVLSEQARARAEQEFSQEVQARRYQRLFEEIVGCTPSARTR